MLRVYRNIYIMHVKLVLVRYCDAKHELLGFCAAEF